MITPMKNRMALGSAGVGIDKTGYENVNSHIYDFRPAYRQAGLRLKQNSLTVSTKHLTLSRGVSG